MSFKEFCTDILSRVQKEREQSELLSKLEELDQKERDLKLQLLQIGKEIEEEKRKLFNKRKNLNSLCELIEEKLEQRSLEASPEPAHVKRRMLVKKRSDEPHKVHCNEFDLTDMEALDKGLIKTTLLLDPLKRTVYIPYKEWSEADPAELSLPYCLCYLFDGKQGVMGTVEAFFLAHNIPKRGFQFMLEKLYSICSAKRFENEEAAFATKMRKALGMLKAVIKKQEDLWHRSKQQFGWTMKTVVQWESFFWPAEALEWMKECEMI